MRSWETKIVDFLGTGDPFRFSCCGGHLLFLFLELCMIQALSARCVLAFDVEGEVFPCLEGIGTSRGMKSYFAPSAGFLGGLCMFLHKDLFGGER